MSDPISYDPSYSFAGFQSSNPNRPLPATSLDNELANVSQSNDSIVAAIKDIRRSDGALKNQIVGPDQLSPALNIGFTNRGTWALSTVYNAGDGVAYNSIFYSARVANTATNTNRPDLDTATWQQLFTLVGIVITDGSIALVKLDTGVQNIINGAAQKSANLSDLASPSVARTNLGVPSLANANTFPSAQIFGSDVSVIGNFSVSGSFSIPTLNVSDFGATTGAFTTLSADSATITTLASSNFRAAIGSAAAPSYSFASDTNTGMYRPGADDLGFATGGVARLKVSNVGAILIGSARIADDNTASSVGMSINAAGAIDIMRSGFSTLYQRRSDASGNLQEFYRSKTTFCGSISVSGSATAYNTSSDERLKDFTGEYDPEEAATIILLDPVRTFNWKEDGSAAIGWGAQTSFALSPDLATHDAGADTWGIDQGKRTPYLWAAMTKVLNWITGADERIAALEGRLSALEAR